MSNVDSLPFVEAQLNYLGQMTERPRYYAYEIGERLRRAMLALTYPAVGSDRNVSSEYYRFPPF